MIKAYILISLILFGISGFAQTDCATISLENVYSLIKEIDYAKRETLAYRNYASFSFKRFVPTVEDLTQTPSFKIGINNKGEIREILRINGKSNITYRLKVYDFPNCRILIPVDEDGKDGYYPTAIVMDNKSQTNFLLSSAIKLGRNNGIILMASGGMDIGNIEDLSTLTILDEELYPIKTLKILREQVVFSCDLNYTKDYRIDYADGYFFFAPELHTDLKVNANSCPKLLADQCVRPEMLLKFRPRSFGKQAEALWDLFGEL